MACPAERMAQEARVLQLLHGPMQINYRSGLMMSLQQSGGSDTAVFITLRRQ